MGVQSRWPRQSLSIPGAIRLAMDCRLPRLHIFLNGNGLIAESSRFTRRR